jgi:hypothetical protein
MIKQEIIDQSINYVLTLHKTRERASKVVVSIKPPEETIIGLYVHDAVSFKRTIEGIEDLSVCYGRKITLTNLVCSLERTAQLRSKITIPEVIGDLIDKFLDEEINVGELVQCIADVNNGEIEEVSSVVEVPKSVVEAFPKDKSILEGVQHAETFIKEFSKNSKLLTKELSGLQEVSKIVDEFVGGWITEEIALERLNDVLLNT